MHPFLDQYIPTEKPGNEDNQELKDRKAEGFKAGKEWTSKYLYRIPYTKADTISALSARGAQGNTADADPEADNPEIDNNIADHLL